MGLLNKKAKNSSLKKSKRMAQNVKDDESDYDDSDRS